VWSWERIGRAGAGRSAAVAEPPLPVLKVVDQDQSTRGRRNAGVLGKPKRVTFVVTAAAGNFCPTRALAHPTMSNRRSTWGISDR